MEIEKLAYTDFISLIREENRPPGGKKTVREWLLNSFSNKNSKVLEVGCTNGFIGLEVARILKCKVWGIDINPNEIKNAKNRIKKEKVKFSLGNAYYLPFKNNFFDLVICSNATSFINKKEKAIEEYSRVTKDWGFIAACPMYYIKNPPKKLVKEVFNEINVPLNIITKKDWTNLFRNSFLEVYFSKDYKFKNKTDKEIRTYVSESLNKSHLKKLPKDVQDKIFYRWERTMKLFNNNLKYIGYSVILLRKRKEKEESELFDSIE